MSQTSPETERAAFIAAHPHLDLIEMPDAWGRPMFKHTHVEAMWAGWKARGHAQTPAEPVMCIGWPTIKRLAAGEAVWFESLGCGAVAASDLRGADIDALLSDTSTGGNSK